MVLSKRRGRLERDLVHFRSVFCGGCCNNDGKGISVKPGCGWFRMELWGR
jgi:hypothetical protein